MPRVSAAALVAASPIIVRALVAAALGAAAALLARSLLRRAAEESRLETPLPFRQAARLGPVAAGHWAAGVQDVIDDRFQFLARDLRPGTNGDGVDGSGGELRQYDRVGALR